MYRHILIPTDGSELSTKAAQSGLQLASALGARVTGVFVAMRFEAVYPDFGLGYAPPPLPDDAGLQEQVAAELLASLGKLAQAAGVPYEGIHVMQDDAALAIIQTAKERACDLIFMASHGRRGVQALLLGSVTHKVLTHCQIPVLVYR